MTQTKPRRKWLRRLLVLAALPVIAALVGRAMLPSLAEEWLEALLSEEVGIELQVDDIALDLRNGHALVTGIRGDVAGQILATSSHAEIEIDFLSLLRGEDTVISIVLHDLDGHLVVLPDKRLNVAHIADAIAAESGPVEGAPPAGQRIALEFDVDDASIRYEDTVTDPSRPLTLLASDVDVRVRSMLVSGPDRADDLMDVMATGLIDQPDEPALFGVGLWEGPDGDGRYREAHAAVTAFDGRQIPQYVTPSAKRILGGYILHASGTMVARNDVIKQGLIQLDVDDSRTSLELRFGGKLGDPRFDMDSPFFEVFRLGYLRVVDAGDSLLAHGSSFGASLWDRTSGVFTESAKGIGKGTLKSIGSGIWRGIKGLFTGHDSDDPDERLERWIGFAKRQIAFRRLTVERRIEVARERQSPEAVAALEAWQATRPWEAQIDKLRAAAGLPPREDESASGED